MDQRQSTCLICSTVTDDQDQSQESWFPHGTFGTEQLSEMFQVLCHYMDWKIKEDCQLDFNVDPFPFCKSCLNPLQDLYKCHLQMQELLKETQRIKWRMTSAILSKFQFKGSVETDSDGRGIKLERVIKDKQQFLDGDNDLGLTGDIHDGAPDLSTLDYKLYYYQRSTYLQYTPSVCLLSMKDFPDLSENELTSSVFVVPEVLMDCDFETFLNSDDNEEDIFEVQSAAASTSICPSNAKNVRYLQESEPEHIVAKAPRGSPSLAIPRTSSELIGVNYSGNEEFIPDKLHVFASTKFASRVEQMEVNKFVFDNKLIFELVNNHEWKCLHCNYTTIERRLIMCHLSSRGTRCDGKRHENAIKGFKYKRVWYDQLKDRRFECRRCPAQTKTENDMKIHIDTSHSGKQNRVTNISYSIEDTMKLFIQENEKGLLACESCQENFESKEAAIEHVSDKHKGKAPKKKFGTKKIGENKYMIGDKYTFVFKDGHFRCDECGYQCTSLSSMRYHVHTEHLNASKKVCEDCGQEFRLAEYLRQHRLRMHSTPATVECNACGRAVAATLLHLHKQRYHEEKTFVCEICGSRFVTKYEMNKHKKRHVSATCPICGKVTTKLFLRRHMNSHSNQYECDQCHKKYTYRAGLRAHKLTCGGQQNYACDVCGAKFAYQHAVARHKKRKHKEQYPASAN